MSTAEAADLLGVSDRSVQRSLQDPDQRSIEWGDEGVGWRVKPLLRRKVYQVSRRAVERKLRPPPST
jgi:hypothetical protein